MKHEYIQRIREFIQKERILPKLTSLLLAVIVWAFVNTKKIEEVHFKVPVQMKNFDHNLYSILRPRNYVGVRLKGNIEDIKNINRKKIKAYIDFSDFDPKVLGNPKKYTVKLEQIVLPDGISLELLDQSILLVIKKKESKSVPVRPVIFGKVSADYMRGGITVKPDHVVIRGLASDIENIDAIETEAIKIDENNTGLLTTKVGLKFENTAKIEINVRNVAVTIPIYNKKDIVILQPEIKIKNVPKSYTYELIDSTVNVYVKINNPDVSISNDDVSVTIDLSDVSEKDFARKGQVVNEIVKYYPANLNELSLYRMISVIEIVPNKVGIKITKEEK